jgi:hypothetical protein
MSSASLGGKADSRSLVGQIGVYNIRPIEESPVALGKRMYPIVPEHYAQSQSRRG